MALILTKVAKETNHIIVTCEQDPTREDIVLEWATPLGFCFRMHPDIAAEFVDRMKTLLPEKNGG